MKLTNEQKAELETKLSMPWGTAKLICDGYIIDLQVLRYKSMTYRVMTFINGEFKGIWISSKEVHPEQKFLRKHVRSLYPPSFKAKMEKIMGKRAFAKDSGYQMKTVNYMPDFASGKAVLSHLCKVCNSIQIADK